MPADIASHPETTKEILSLTRFAIIGTLAVAGLLLIADLVGRGWNTPEWRFLSERVVTTLIYAIAAEVFIAIAAVTCLALFKPESRRSIP